VAHRIAFSVPAVVDSFCCCPDLNFGSRRPTCTYNTHKLVKPKSNPSIPSYPITAITYILKPNASKRALSTRHFLTLLFLTHHRKQPPRRVTRLRTNTKPVFCPYRIELDVFIRPALAISRQFRDRVVRPEDFDGLAVACRSSREASALGASRTAPGIAQTGTRMQCRKGEGLGIGGESGERLEESR
jgi:hypothetical protein